MPHCLKLLLKIGNSSRLLKKKTLFKMAPQTEVEWSLKKFICTPNSPNLYDKITTNANLLNSNVDEAQANCFSTIAL